VPTPNPRPLTVPSPTTSPDDSALVTARRVLNQESQALALLATCIGDSFSQAVATIANAVDRDGGGRVIVTGMGKSGHVGHKIAATLASTGTPAHFVHPSEASHGDLGMITRSDVLLALSQSGETAELSDFVCHSRRHAIPLIVLTGQAGSTLDQAADTALILPPVEEACSLGMAPTTSTTLAMALGDALAVALLERRGFTSEDYVALHPRGQLSGRLLRVEQIMHRGDALPLVATGASMGDAIVAIAEKSFGCVGVMDGARLVGIITDGDLKRHMDAALLNRSVDEIMTAQPLNLAPLDLAVTALRAMNERPCFVAFVVEGDAPVGILHMHDCLRAGVI